MLVMVTRKKKKPEEKGKSCKLANSDENSIGKLEEIALKSSSQIKYADLWVDSGASQQITPQKKSLNDYSTFETPLKLADDRVLYTYGKGNVHLTVLNGNDKINIISKDVLFVLKLQNKLFPLPSITRKGVIVEFKGKASEITIDGKQYTIDRKHGKCYELNTTITEVNNPEPLELWHQPYGHLGYDNLKLLYNTDMMNGLNFDSKEAVDGNCERWGMGK